MLTSGCSHEVSSSVPDFSQSSSGVTSSSVMMGAPHLRQKCRRTSRPLPPLCGYTPGTSPLYSSVPLAKPTLTENELPDCRWHCLHWHSSVITGSAADR